MLLYLLCCAVQLVIILAIFQGTCNKMDAFYGFRNHSLRENVLEDRPFLICCCLFVSACIPIAGLVPIIVGSLIGAKDIGFTLNWKGNSNAF